MRPQRCVNLVVMLSAARQALPSMWDSGAAEGLESLGGEEEGNAAAAVGSGATTSGLGRLGAGAGGCGGAAAKQTNMSSSMAEDTGEAAGTREQTSGCRY